MKQYLAFPAQLHAIGLATVLWANLDAQILAALIRLDAISVDQRYAFRRKPSGVKRYQFATQLLRDAGMQTVPQRLLQDEIAAALALWSSERNLVTHGQYGVVSDGSNADRLIWWDLSWGEADVDCGEDVNLDDLTDHAERVSKIIDRVKRIDDPKLATLTQRSALNL